MKNGVVTKKWACEGTRRLFEMLDAIDRKSLAAIEAYKRAEAESREEKNGKKPGADRLWRKRQSV